MTYIIKSPYLARIIDPEDAGRCLASWKDRFPTVDVTKMKVWNHMELDSYLAFSRWNDPPWLSPQPKKSPHLGIDLYIFQGLEDKTWWILDNPQAMKVTPDQHSRVKGHITLALPQPMQPINLNCDLSSDGFLARASIES